MGQPVAVTEKPSASPGVVRFETNRNFTGVGHERFVHDAPVKGKTPSAEIARRLFATGQVAGVHVYMNIITVDLAKGRTSDGLGEIIHNLYQYWKPGMPPPSFEDFAEPAAAEAPAAGGGGGDDAAAAALSEAAKRVPAHLLERSRLAREKFKAK